MSEHADPPLELRFDRLASLLPVFEPPDFSFGTAKAAEQFVEIAYEDGWVRPEFAWMEWLGTDHHQRFEQDHETVADASAGELAQLLTTHIRLDRFSYGALEEAGQSGLFTAILRRIDRLHREAAG